MNLEAAVVAIVAFAVVRIGAKALKKMTSAFSAVTVAVVGVVLNLAV